MKNIRWIVVLAGCAALCPSIALAAEKQTTPSTPPARREILANEDRLNIESLRPLNAQGSYVHIIGRSLFLTPGVVLGRLKPPEADAMRGGWFDLSTDPATPKLVYDCLPMAWDMTLVGDYAIACNYRKFLTIYDTRERPWREVGKLDMPSMTENIITRGNLAYVANHDAGLTIVNISKPTQPHIVSNFDPKIDCDAVAFWKDSAVLYGHHEGQIVMADISDPAKPRQTGVCQLPRILNGGELEVADGFVYATSRKGLFVVHVADPANPRQVATVELGAVAHDVILKDHFAFVAADEQGVRVLDVADPRKPIEVGHYRAGKEFVALAVAVERDARNAADYYIYTANMTGPATVLLFHAPARGGVEKQMKK